MGAFSDVVFLIFTGAAVVATLALFARQPVLLAYIALGILIGPYGAGAIQDLQLIEQIAHIGIIFLLFLLGLDLRPSHLLQLLGRSSVVAGGSTLLVFAIAFGIARLFGIAPVPAAVIGIAMVFSSTILGIKLLPTTALHHRHIGEVVVSQLLLQDFIAILVLIGINSLQLGSGTQQWLSLAWLPCLVLASMGGVRYVIMPLIQRYDRIHEYLFLLSIGWCLGFAKLAHLGNVSEEMGALIAGISLASTPIANYITQALKPLRDFFLVLFFFTLGARLHWQLLGDLWWLVITLSACLLILKPLIFEWLFRLSNEPADVAREAGVRLGQASEFSLLVALLAVQTGIIDERISAAITSIAIIAFAVSSYRVILRYPSPLALNDKLRRD